MFDSHCHFPTYRELPEETHRTQPLAQYEKLPWVYLSPVLQIIEDALDLPEEQEQHYLTLELR